MDRKELAYAKQALFGVKDWDAFQAVIRLWARLMKPDPGGCTRMTFSPVSSLNSKKLSSEY
jgi:hypothetical protein